MFNMDLHEKVPSFLAFDSLESSPTIGVKPSKKEEKISLLEWLFGGCFGFLSVFTIVFKNYDQGGLWRFPNVVYRQLVGSTNLLP